MIDRLSHVALYAPDPAAAAAFAAEKMGFSVAHIAPDGTHYLKAHGPDPYSIVYTKGDAGLHHASFLVRDQAALEAAKTHLAGLGVLVEEVAEIEWEHAPAIRFQSPAGFLYELTTGIQTDLPVAHMIDAPEDPLAPIAADHIGLVVPDFEAELEFAQTALQLLPSNRVLAPDGVQAVSFLRSRNRFLYHQLVIFRGQEKSVQHYQMTLKSVDAFYSARDALQQNGVTIAWGPLRHGPGHNIALYLKDAAGYWMEYSVEEEIILDDDHYVPRTWTINDPHVIDEWQSGPPPAGMIDPPPPPPDTLEQVRLRKEVVARSQQMLNLQLFVGLSKVNMTSPPPPIDVVYAHQEWAIELEASGKLFAAGPFVDDGGAIAGDGLYLIRAADRPEAQAILAADPIHAGGFRICTVYSWRVHEGKMSLSVTFSDKGYAFA